MKDVLGSIQGMCILLFAMFILLAVIDFFDDSYPFNSTEEVKYKDISHIKGVNDGNQYNIYTDNNSFRVALNDYNNISKGDKLIVEYESFGSPKLYYNDRYYYAT